MLTPHNNLIDSFTTQTVDRINDLTSTSDSNQVIDVIEKYLLHTNYFN